jgi:hypothetical protein
MSTERRLVLATRPCRCSCPCPAAHRAPYAPSVTCLETMPAGSTVGVTLIDGTYVSARCLPCATASGWADVIHATLVRAGTAEVAP